MGLGVHLVPFGNMSDRPEYPYTYLQVHCRRQRCCNNNNFDPCGSTTPNKILMVKWAYIPTVLCGCVLPANSQRTNCPKGYNACSPGTGPRRRSPAPSLASGQKKLNGIQPADVRDIAPNEC